MPTEATVDIHAATIVCVRSLHKAPQSSWIDVEVCVRQCGSAVVWITSVSRTLMSQREKAASQSTSKTRRRRRGEEGPETRRAKTRQARTRQRALHPSCSSSTCRRAPSYVLLLTSSSLPLFSGFLGRCVGSACGLVSLALGNIALVD